MRFFSSAFSAALGLLTLPLKLTTGDYIIKFEDVDVGKVDGFTSSDDMRSYSRYRGDYLTSTFCFCEQPDPTEWNYGDAVYFQFEYYNYHQDVTYILHHIAHEVNISATTWLPPHGGLCRKWSVPGRHDDKLCYVPAAREPEYRLARLPEFETYLRFNRQSRELSERGGQGPVLGSQSEAEDKCDSMCDEHVGTYMRAVRFNDLAQCHMVVHTDLDDMCDHCQ